MGESLSGLRVVTGAEPCTQQGLDDYVRLLYVSTLVNSFKQGHSDTCLCPQDGLVLGGERRLCPAWVSGEGWASGAGTLGHSGPHAPLFPCPSPGLCLSPGCLMAVLSACPSHIGPVRPVAPYLGREPLSRAPQSPVPCK